MQGGVEGACIEHGSGDMHTENWRRILKWDHMEDLELDTIKH